MCRVLVLDDDKFGAQTVKLVIEDRSDNTVDVATSSRDAADLVTRSIQDGEPYEVFLIDQQLEAGENGIEVMQSLRHISPDTETIIFTGYGDNSVGMNAYKSGAFRYLAKGYENAELLYLIEAVHERRKTQRAHGWQKIFSEMMEAALQGRYFHDAADVIVNYSLKLGFERAHLFWIPTGEDINRNNLFIGIACAGSNRIRKFRQTLYPVAEWFDLDFSGEVNNAVFIRNFKSLHTPNSPEKFGYRLPVLEATILPIQQANALRGLLLLDYGQARRTVSDHERSLLNLFARQVSVVLNQASLHGREQWLLQESAIIQKIGREITTKAASANLIDLLEEIRRQIGESMDVSNFSVFLLNEESNELTFPLLYENDVRRQGKGRSLDNGFEEYLLASQQEILLSPGELISFTRERQIDFRGSIPYSLLGVPLRMEEKTIGGMIVSQYSFQGSEYIENDKRILLSVADQVAGAIQISRLSDAEREETRRMQVLHMASTEMLRIAQENEDHFWLTLLTIATSDFGLGFNRALLFVEKENFRRLMGRMGVGTDNVEEARRDWERDEKRRYEFQNFLDELKKGKRRSTAFERLVRQVEFDFDLANGTDAISQVIRDKARLTLAEEEVEARLPAEITRTFSLTHCAILPIRAGEKVTGVVIVDNKHNHERLKERSLVHLQSLLDNAGLVYQTLIEQKKSASLLTANYEILEGAKDESLQITLSRICNTAQSFTAADWVIILPLLGTGNRHFDLDNIGFAGTLKNSLKDVIGDSPNFGGISQRVLRRGTLVVNNIDDPKNQVNRQLKISEHHFIQSEGVKALIGAVVRSRDDEEPLGLLYIDYREPRTFSDQEKQQALSFASLAGVAISNSRRMDELHQRRQLKAVKEIAETIGLGLALESTMDAVLKTLHNLFERTHLCVLLYQSDERALKFAPATLKYYKIQNSEYHKQDSFHLDKGGIACRVARASIKNQRVEFENVRDVSRETDYLQLNFRIKSEFCVSLLSTTNELLGVLVLERDRLNGFDSDDADLIKMVAQHLSIAIQRAQQSEKLEFRTTVAAQTAWAADIAHEINNEVGQIRNWAYMLRDQLEEGSKLQEYAQKIEQSASVLSSTGPWSDRPPQVVKLDLFLERNLRNLTGQRNIPVEYNFCAQDVYIRVNPAEFQHVLRHLVRNAARAMNNVRVRKLLVTTQTINGSLVEILFQDSGPGIKKDVQLSIFQRPITTKGRGGYGLLLVRQMIEDMGGKIRLVPQKKGQGAVFSIRFPIATTLQGTEE